VDLRQLRYFVAVAEELHFSRAAARLPLSPAALSQAVRGLEQDLGSDLLVRAPAVALTPAGAVLLEHAYGILARVDEPHAAVRRGAGGAAVTLTVGSAGVGAAELTAPLIRGFAAARPDVRVVLRDLDYAAQRSALLGGRVDVAFVRTPMTDEGLELTPLAEEPRVAVLAATHPLAGGAGDDVIAVEDLLDETFVAFDRDVPRGWAEHWWLCAHRDGAPPLRLGAHRVRSDLELLADVAFHGTVVTAPAALARRSALDGVAFRPLAGAAPSGLGLAARADDERRVVAAFVRATAKLTRELLALLPGAVLPSVEAVPAPAALR